MKTNLHFLLFRNISQCISSAESIPHLKIIGAMLLVVFGLLLMSTGAKGQCVLLNEPFNINPVLSPTNLDGAWYPARYPPAGFVSGVISDKNALVISIRAADGAQLRPVVYSSNFYNTQGRKINQCGKCVTIWSGDVYIPSDWANKRRSTDISATAFNVADEVSAYAIPGRKWFAKS